MINDPWPTPFPNGGFDLDAIGVIHQNTSVGLKENNLDDNLYLYPNPINKGEKLLLSTSKDILFVSVYNFSGQKILSTKENFISTSELTEGIYFIEVNSVNNSITKKLLIK
jgi:hypothetical protein